MTTQDAVISIAQMVLRQRRGDNYETEVSHEEILNAVQDAAKLVFAAESERVRVAANAELFRRYSLD